MASASPPAAPVGGASAGSLLRRGKLWVFPGVLSGLVALLLSLLYMGGILNPDGSLHRLPVALVDADDGRPLPGDRQNLGARISAAIVSSSPGDDVRWRRLTRAEAPLVPTPCPLIPLFRSAALAQACLRQPPLVPPAT